MASPLFFKRLRHNLGLELLLKIHLLQASVFFLELLEPGHHGNIHPAVFGSPLVKRGRADPQFTAHIWHPKAGIDPFQRLHDLAIAVSGLLHIEPFPLEKILLPAPTLYWDDYRGKSTGPRTEEGLLRSGRAKLNHGTQTRRVRLAHKKAILAIRALEESALLYGIPWGPKMPGKKPS